MEKQILNFTVNEQILVCENPIKISTNKVNYIQAHFDLGENWSGFDSVRAVWFNDFNCISTVLDSLGNCAVPFEVMKRKGNVKVNLVGSISEDDVLTDRLTSYPVVAVIVDCTAQITGANTSPITPSEFEQFAQRVHTDAERAEQGASNAETSAQNASDSATSAHNSAESAHDDKIAIEEAIAEVIQQIEDFEQVQVVVNTLPPTSPATSDFTDGVLTLGIPQGVKGDTGNGIQSISKVGTSGLVDTYRITYTNGQTTTFTVTNGAKGDTGNGIASIEKTSTVGLVDTYTITYTDGTTTTFTVTNGEKGDKGDTGEVSLSELEQATVVQTLSDTEPYNFRRTNNGNGAGVREYDEIVGASVGWNQLQDGTLTSYSNANGTISTDQDGVTTYTVVSVKNGNYENAIYGKAFDRIAGHKYLSSYDIYVGKSSLVDKVYIGNAVETVVVNTGWNTLRSIINASSSYNISQPLYGISKASDYGYAVGDTYKIKNMMLTDLTLFNSTIADYVYTLEQSTAGSGVAWLKTHFPKLFDSGYQPFDAGSIKSVSGLEGHEMVGVNQWNGEYESGGINQNTGQDSETAGFYRSKYISVLPNTVYYFKLPVQMMAFWYDADKNYLARTSPTDGATRISPLDAKYMRFRNQSSGTWTPSTNDELCINLSDTSINGQYFPYEKHTYPLDSSVVLRGKYVLDNGQLKAVGDVWHPNDGIDRNYAEVDLGSLNYTYDSSISSMYTTLSLLKQVTASSVPINAVTSVGKIIKADDRITESGLVIYAFGNDSTVYFRNTGYTDASAFKTAMSGKMFVYEKATSSTESATPYTNPQWCDSHGTEEYVGSELPVGHNTDYPMTLIDTADGLSNGTYEPRITVTNGKKTVTWVSV